MAPTSAPSGPGLAFYRLKPQASASPSTARAGGGDLRRPLRESGRPTTTTTTCRRSRPLQAIRVAPDVARGFEAGPDGLELLAFGPHHEKDGERFIHEGFWDD